VSSPYRADLEALVGRSGWLTDRRSRLLGRLKPP